MELVGTLAAVVFALLAAWLAPGHAIVRATGLGRDGLERLVLAWSLGRATLALVSLLAASTVGAGIVPIFAVAGAAAWLRVGRTQREPLRGGRGIPRDALLPVAFALAAACLLVVAVVARGGLPDGSGGLVFQGRDATNDPLVYTAIARQLHETGLPLTYPLASGASSTSTYLPYGVFVGLHALGVPMLDAALRVTPLAEGVALALTAVALVRRLGGPPLAAGLGGVLVMLGAGLSSAVVGLARLLGAPAAPLDTWAFFGPYLLAFNPVAPALQTALAALLLVAALPGGGRRTALAAGLLVASLFETKLFVFAPVFGALLCVAFLGPPAALASLLRRTATVATLAATPFLLEKLYWANALRGRELTGFVACPGCLSRYLVEGSLLGGDLSFERFESFRLASLLDPSALAAAFAASVVLVGVGLGIRLAALPALWRGALGTGEAGLVAVHRIVGLAVLASVAAALLVTTRPHYLNGAQFALAGAVLLWPFAAGPLAAWLVRRRALAAVALAALLLPGVGRAVLDLGFGAQPLRVVPHESLELSAWVRERTAPGDVIVEPSMLADTDFPSPITWQAGRSVYLTLLSAAEILPEAEVFARHERLVAIFAERDRSAALEALATSEADWLLAPRAWPLRFEPGVALEPVLEHPAGKLYRIAPKAAR